MKYSSIRYILFLLFSALVVADANAQYYTNQNKMWGFGGNGGIDFTSGSPVAFVSAVVTEEGCTTVCDSAGTLLFVTDGYNVRNAAGSVMPNGGFIAGVSTWRAGQASVITPVLSNPDRYYIFTMEQAPGTTGYCNLKYSIVDMTLDGGSGDVMTSYRGVPVANGLSEKMVSVRGDSCNIWLITHRKDSAVFWVYNITAAGISGPVISSVGSFTGADSYTEGLIKVSHSRRLLVSQVNGPANGTELYDFNPLTGVVSNCRVLSSTVPGYSAEFSPDDSKLYVDDYDDNKISQYNLSLPTTAAIIASLTVIGTGGYDYGDMKLGPDGKIYLPKAALDQMDRIDNPNAAGSSCAFVSDAFTLVLGTWANHGMPSVVYVPAVGVAAPVTGPSSVCTGDTITLVDTAMEGVWVSSNPAIAAVGSATGLIIGLAAGTDTILYIVDRGCGADTARHVITVVPCSLHTGAVAENSSAIILAPNPNSGTFSMLISSPYNEDAHVVITDALGRKVKDIVTETNKEKQVTGCPPGIYFVTAITSHDRVGTKVIVR